MPTPFPTPSFASWGGRGGGGGSVHSVTPSAVRPPSCPRPFPRPALRAGKNCAQRHALSSATAITMPTPSDWQLEIQSEPIVGISSLFFNVEIRCSCALGCHGSRWRGCATMRAMAGVCHYASAAQPRAHTRVTVTTQPQRAQGWWG
jgi:hypothetical protein